MENSHLCEQREKSFARNGLKFHIQTIHKKKRHNCEEFGKTFSQKVSLQLHMRTQHSTDKPEFQCKYCQKTFSYLQNMVSHQESAHLKLKHPCDLCSKLFTCQQNLKNHIKEVHEKVKNFACKICSKTFSRANNLKAHIQAVHEGITHKYETCGKKFARKENVKRHICK